MAPATPLSHAAAKGEAANDQQLDQFVSFDNTIAILEVYVRYNLSSVSHLFFKSGGAAHLERNENSHLGWNQPKLHQTD
jgi:hypothetical protein